MKLVKWVKLVIPAAKPRPVLPALPLLPTLPVGAPSGGSKFSESSLHIQWSHPELTGYTTGVLSIIRLRSNKLGGPAAQLRGVLSYLALGELRRMGRPPNHMRAEHDEIVKEQRTLFKHNAHDAGNISVPESGPGTRPWKAEHEETIHLSKEHGGVYRFQFIVYR